MLQPATSLVGRKLEVRSITNKIEFLNQICVILLQKASEIVRKL